MCSDQALGGARGKARLMGEGADRATRSRLTNGLVWLENRGLSESSAGAGVPRRSREQRLRALQQANEVRTKCQPSTSTSCLSTHPTGWPIPSFTTRRSPSVECLSLTTASAKTSGASHGSMVTKATTANSRSPSRRATTQRSGRRRLEEAARRPIGCPVLQFPQWLALSEWRPQMGLSGVSPRPSPSTRQGMARGLVSCGSARR